MAKDVLHRAGLEAMIALATAPPRWRNKSELAADCGFTPSTLSNALAGRRNLSGLTLGSLSNAFAQASGTGSSVFREALVLPWVAQPGDLRSADLDRRLRAVQDELTTLHRELRDYNRGD